MQHTVAQGEHAARIAREQGFRDWKTVWQHPENDGLRASRDNPNVLFPGDAMFVPDRLERREACATGQIHTFVAPALRLRLKIVLQDVNGDPLPTSDCQLAIGGEEKGLVTGAGGELEEEIPVSAEQGEIRISGESWQLAVGHLDPVEESSGQHARLANLGYYLAEGAEVDEQEFRCAVEEFQCDCGLPVNGVCGAATRDALKQVHGC